MALFEAQRVTAPNEPFVPGDIKRLRRQNFDWLKRIGQTVVVLHRYTQEDLDKGVAKNCPACYDAIYGNTRNDCEICFGVGLVSTTDDPHDYIDTDNRTRVASNTGTGVKAPLFGGYRDPYLTFMVEPDRPTDIFQISPQGALIRTKEAQGFAPWFPTLYDNDLCANVIVDNTSLKILEATDRFILSKVEPVTIRGHGRVAKYQRYLVAQQFEMQRIPNGPYPL